MTQISHECNFAIVGGGAAGFFAAHRLNELHPNAKILLLESGKPLKKVRISGGGRCNVTTGHSDTDFIASCYPRGSRFMKSALHHFGPEDVQKWFGHKGIRLKTEPDMRMFPVSDNSADIADCLLRILNQPQVRLIKAKLTGISLSAENRIILTASNNNLQVQITADSCLLATGGNTAARICPDSVPVTDCVPSLFSFHIQTGNLSRQLAGISFKNISVRFLREKNVEPASLFKQSWQGAAIITHEGLSGPAVLKASAFGARYLAVKNYNAKIRLNWTGTTRENVEEQMLAADKQKLTANTPVAGIPDRFWKFIMQSLNIDMSVRNSGLSKQNRKRIVEILTESELTITGKSLNKEEFVTAGGVDLKEVDRNTMESKKIRNLFFAGEILDIDGITGGYNFQAAWTTAWIAATAMAEKAGNNCSEM